MTEHRGVAPVFALVALALAVLLLSAGVAAAFFYTGGGDSAYGATVAINQQQTEQGTTQLTIEVSSFGNADRVIIEQQNGNYSAELTANSTSTSVTVGDRLNDLSANESGDGDGGGVATGETYEVYAVQDGNRKLIQRYTV